MSPQTILIVDDSFSTRRILKAHLNSLDVELLDADGAESAMKLAREVELSLIICDILMPGIDGFSMVKMIRQDPKLAKLPVILLTSDNSESMKEKMKEAGADELLHKSVPTEVLLATAKRYLKKAET